MIFIKKYASSSGKLADIKPLAKIAAKKAKNGDKAMSLGIKFIDDYNILGIANYTGYVASNLSTEGAIIISHGIESGHITKDSLKEQMPGTTDNPIEGSSAIMNSGEVKMSEDGSRVIGGF